MARGKLFTGRFYPDLEDRFLEWIQAGEGPLDPVLVLAPTGGLQRRLRRRIAASGGKAGVHFHGFESLASYLALPLLAGQEATLLPDGGEILLMERVLADLDLGYFQPARNEARFAHALLATCRDLRDAGISAADYAGTARALAGNRGKLADLARIYAAYRKALEERRLLDGSDLLAAAATALRERRASLPARSRLAIYGVYDFTGLQRGLLRELLGQEMDFAIFLPPADSFTEPAKEFFSAFAEPEVLSGTAAKPSVTVLSAAGEEAEVREAVREVVALQEKGIPLREMALVARNTRPYDAAIREGMQRAGLPLSPARGKALREDPLARTFLLALDLASRSGSTREWQNLTDLPALAEDAFPSPKHLQAAWRKFPSRAAPDRHAAVLIGLAETMFPASIQRDSLLEILGGLASLKKITDRLTRNEVRDVLERLLDRRESGGEGQGVFWGDPMAARGIPFRAILILGMESKGFPRPPAMDPILLDGERESLAAKLPTSLLQPKGRGRVEEPYLFALLRDGARDSLHLIRSRMDPITGKEKMPSPFLADQPPESYRSPLRFWSSKGRGKPVDLQEFDLRLLDSLAAGKASLAAAYLKHIFPDSVRHGLALESSRWESQGLTPFSGDVGAKVAESHADLRPGDSISPTRLERLARCPFAYFLRQIGIEKLRDPEDSTPDPLKSGTLMHDVLQRFFSSFESGRPLGDIDEKEREKVLLGVIEEAWSQGTGLRPASRAESLALRESFLETIRKYLTDQIKKNYSVPWKLEWPLPEGVTFAAGDHTLKLTGRVDRIDLDGERARIVDFKFAKGKAIKGDLRGGRRLQIALYAHALTRDLGVTEVAGEYHFLRDQKIAKLQSLGETPPVQEAVGTLLHLAREGLFPQLPDECEFCDYRLACAGEQTGVFRLKKQEPRLGAFYSLRAPGEGTV